MIWQHGSHSHIAMPRYNTGTATCAFKSALTGCETVLGDLLKDRQPSQYINGPRNSPLKASNIHCQPLWGANCTAVQATSFSLATTAFLQHELVTVAQAQAYGWRQCTSGWRQKIIAVHQRLDATLPAICMSAKPWLSLRTDSPPSLTG
jgi:hypothetical protein